MAEFTEYLQRLRPCQSFTGMDMNMEMLKQIPEPNPSILESFSASDQFSIDSFLAHQQSEFPENYSHSNLSCAFEPDIFNALPVIRTFASNQNVFPEGKKRKVMEPSTSSSKNISPTVSATNTKKKNSIWRDKKGKSKENEADKAEEVVHVRAKRGQATDSHSIAERVRREKINNKLRCLQDLVPGCNKSMGMAVMLEEIINYVHSLQNQVEFLSMELAAANCSYNLNLEPESFKKAQETNTPGAQEMHKWLRERYGEVTCFHSTWSS